MSAPVLLFTDDADLSVELSGADLPNSSLALGGKLRKNITRYAGGHTSAQIFGVTDEPKIFEGFFDDHWTGVPGHAAAQKRAVEDLLYGATLIRMEWEGEQFWGLFEAVLEQHTLERVGYRIEFTPTFRRPPQQEAGFAFDVAPPKEFLSTIDSQLAELVAYAQTSSDGGSMDEVLAGQVVLALLKAEAAVGAALSSVRTAEYWSDLTVELARSAVRSLNGATKALGDVVGSLRNATTSFITGAGAEQLLAEAWRDNVLAGAFQSRAEVLRMLLEVLNVTEPVGRRRHTVNEGDTLQRLAHQYYGDFSLWTHIADANELETDTLTVGDELLIPRL